MVECHFWVINSPIETGSSASSCLRIKGQLCAKKCHERQSMCSSAGLDFSTDLQQEDIDQLKVQSADVESSSSVRADACARHSGTP